MKKFFFSLVAIVFATMSYAQSSMLATLSHEGEISTFYGTLALRDAYNAAQSGDVITLSSGTFNAVNIDKAVIIRGAGMGIDPTAQSEPTVLTGDFSINIPDEDTNRLTIEGIYHNAKITMANFKNGTFLKDRFKEITCNDRDKNCCANLTMIHCKVTEELYLPENSPISCVNCIIVYPNNYYGGSNPNSTSPIEFSNCVVKGPYDTCFRNLRSCNFKNCILDYRGYDAFGDYGNTVYNCVGVGSEHKGLFSQIPNSTNVYKSFDEVFKTYAGQYNDDESFEITDGIKESIKGIDGTEVGIYGGNLPFSTTPTNPQITKCNVAAKSTADGKLSVDITVNGAE